MMLDQIISYIVTIFGIAFSAGYFPQAYKIWKSKSAEDVSLLTAYIFVSGTTVWTLYGFYKHDMTIILSFFFGMIGSWLVLILTLRYKRKK